MESVSEPNHATSINISFALVPCSSNLIEVSENKPSSPMRRLETDKLGEELILKRIIRRPIDGGNLEVSVLRSIRKGYIRGQRELGDSRVGDGNHGIIPKEKDSTPRAIGRLVNEAFEPITANVCSVER
jgi:hypothetical protein